MATARRTGPRIPLPILYVTLQETLLGLFTRWAKQKAAIIGHDWGAPVAWCCALLRPDMFRAVGLLSVPYLADFWSGPRPTEAMRHLLASGQMFYQLYFQEPGRAEAHLERDVRDSLVRLFYCASGEAQPEEHWRFLFSPNEEIMDTLPKPKRLPSWLSEDELSVFVKEFNRTGFTGGLNWYRNMDRDQELLGFLAKSTVIQPTIFVAGSEDAVVSMYRPAFDSMEKTVPNLHAKDPHSGHRPLGAAGKARGSEPSSVEVPFRSVSSELRFTLL